MPSTAFADSAWRFKSPKYSTILLLINNLQRTKRGSVQGNVQVLKVTGQVARRTARTAVSGVFYPTAPSGAKSCLFPSAYAFLSIRNFTQCTRQQIFLRRC